mgnify:CR=1 FL=1
MLAFGGLIEPVKREFSKKRCAHKKGTHRALRGADSYGKYYTAASAHYSARLCAGFARTVSAYLKNTVLHGEVSALVSGVLHGKRLPRNSVDAKFFHDSFNHGEQRVLEYLQHALSDFEPWMAECIKKNPIGPCDACLKGKAPLVGPSGGLPQHENLLFIDFYHCNVPAIFTGNTARLTSKHAGKSKFVKSVSCRKKSDAPAAVELILAFYNSKGCPIGHLHSDCANELRAGGVAPLAAKHKIRITTNVPGRSNSNGVEPIHRVGRDVVGTALAQSKLPLAFHDLCWAWFEDGHALKPSRDPPHDCSLGRLTNIKPKGKYRRPFGVLGYLTEAPRLPNGTLANKYKEQAVRVLIMGYMGGESGAYDAIGVEKCQPGYLCFEPTRCCLLIGESVRCIPGCFPGLKRTAGGGWIIPPENIPFSAESLALKHPLAAPPQDKDSEPSIIDLDSEASTDHIGDFDYERLTWTKGMPDEPPATEAPKAKEATETATDDTPSKAPTQPRLAIVPSDMWPDYVCNENGGAGWTVEIVDTKGKYSRCKFLDVHTDAEGRKFYSEYIETARLLPPAKLTDEQPVSLDTQPVSLDTQPVSLDTKEPAASPTQEPEETPPPDQWLVPNQNTLPHEAGADPLKEPTRPKRERHEVDRYSPAMLSASYASAAGAKYDSAELPEFDEMYVSLDGMSERFANLAFNATDETQASAARDAFESLPIEAQRAACIMADYDVLATELGATSPQAKLAREAYAAAVFDAACAGISLPPIDPLYDVTPLCGAPADGQGESAPVPLDQIFDKVHDHSMISVPDDALGAKVFADGTVSYLSAFGDLALLAKKRTSPDIYAEKEMKGAEWDEPKQIEINKLEKMFEKVTADDPRVSHLKPVDTMWTGRDKRAADRTICEKKGRCVLRGDKHQQFYNISENAATSPVVRITSASCGDAVAALRRRHTRSGDVPTAYLQGNQTESEQVLARPPHDFRESDEDGKEILWLMNNPLYGQVDAGAIWNRTFNDTMTRPRDGKGKSLDGAEVQLEYAAGHADCVASPTSKSLPSTLEQWKGNPSAGLGAERDTYDPCVYSRVVNDDGDRVVTNVYVDDCRMYWDTSEEACTAAKADQEMLYARHKIKWGEVDQADDYFLGANRGVSKARDVVTVSASTYILGMKERYLDGDDSPCKERPTYWTYTPADENLTKAYEAAIVHRTPAPKALFKEYNSLVGSLRHAVKYRPEIAAAMDLLGCCLTFPTPDLLKCANHVLVYLTRTHKMKVTYSMHAPMADQLHAFADSNWRHTRSTSGWVIFLGGAGVSCGCRRQGGISMSSTEAELTALADCAIELIAIIGVLAALGYVAAKAIEVGTDNKGAWQLCHRFTSAQHSRHIDRKLFKMRELRGKEVVTVKYVPTDDNPADLFTKVLSRQPFEKHRRKVMNITG